VTTTLRMGMLQSEDSVHQLNFALVARIDF
jgi:hypothetical protein